MLGFCIFLSVLLVTAFALMYLGPTVQTFLPAGGDTRKLADLLLAVTAAGCSIFTVYASSLFFRYRSREYGILLALGEPKKNLKKLLFQELAVLTCSAAGLGLVTAIPASWLIWKLFELFLVSTSEMNYRFGFAGFFVGIGFSFILMLLLCIAGLRFVNRSNIIDILKTGHQSEMVKEIKVWTFPAGIFCIIAGLLLGIGLPSAAAKIFHILLPGITNLFYVLVLLGIYFVILSIVAQNRAQKNKKKFYKNMVSISLMRFSAKSATRNMCVIVLLLFVCLFSSFYGMLYTDTTGLSSLKNSKAFVLHYPAEEEQLTQEDIYRTARNHSVDIQDFTGGEAANLVISYKNRDLTDDNRYVEIENEKSKTALFFSASTYKALTGRSVHVSSGSYMTITTTDYKETIWDFLDGLYEITNPDTGTSLPLSCAGSLEYDAFASMSDPFAYVLSDSDYRQITAGITDMYLEKLILFNVADLEASYSFGKDLIGQYVAHATARSNHIVKYDMWEEKLALENGGEYSYDLTFDMSADNAMLLDDWKYAPQFAIVTTQDFLQLICIYVMLCLYIFIIALAAAAVMTYVRSISIATDNTYLFHNLEKLGADTDYQRNILKKQLAKIFQYPGILGCSLSCIYAIIMCWFNDGRFTANEIKTLLILICISAFVLFFLYVIYRIARKKAEMIIGVTSRR